MLFDYKNQKHLGDIYGANAKLFTFGTNNKHHPLYTLKCKHEIDRMT